MAPPYSVEIVHETSSTQDDARRLFAGTPVLVVAGSQTAGRGRAGSAWQNADRALAASLAWNPGWSPETWPLIPLVAGVAAARTIPGVTLKWPNDVEREGRKVGGILSEARGVTVVVGLGLNVWWSDPPEGAGSIHPRDPGPEAGEQLARRWAEHLLGALEDGPEAWPRESYLEACTTVGRSITWEPDGAGTAVDVDPGGGLVVETSAGRQVLRAGEVRHVR